MGEKKKERYFSHQYGGNFFCGWNVGFAALWRSPLASARLGAGLPSQPWARVPVWGGSAGWGLQDRS